MKPSKRGLSRRLNKSSKYLQIVLVNCKTFYIFHLEGRKCWRGTNVNMGTFAIEDECDDRSEEERERKGTFRRKGKHIRKKSSFFFLSHIKLYFTFRIFVIFILSHIKKGILKEFRTLSINRLFLAVHGTLRCEQRCIYVSSYQNGSPKHYLGHLFSTRREFAF